VFRVGGHFEHNAVTVNLFSLMNFMFYTTLDAVGNILRVHDKSMKCDVSFSQGSVSWPTVVPELAYDHKCNVTF